MHAKLQVQLGDICACSCILHKFDAWLRAHGLCDSFIGSSATLSRQQVDHLQKDMGAIIKQGCLV